jgi:hypothetical protein
MPRLAWADMSMDEFNSIIEGPRREGILEGFDSTVGDFRSGSESKDATVVTVELVFV